MMATHSKRENICQPNPWFQRYKIVLEMSLIQTKRLKTVNFSWLTENFKKCKITIIIIIVIITAFSGV